MSQNKKPNPSPKPETPTDHEIEFAKALVDQAFEPALTKLIKTLNGALAKRGLRAGIEVTWFFDRIDEEPQIKEESNES